MRHLESYVRAALEAAKDEGHARGCPGMGGTCTCHVGKARFALSLYTKHGHLCAPTGEEFKEAIGCTDDQTWVLCRRSPRAIRQYGENAIFLSEKQYAAGELKALQTRMSRMGVAQFEPAPCA